LLCASWISIQSHPGKGKDQQQDKVSSADTTIKKHNKRTTRTAKKTVTPELDVAREAEISEEEEFEVVVAPEPFTYVPPVVVEVPQLLEMEELIAPTPPIEVAINLAMDTIPPVKWGPNRDWEKFSKEFELKFKEQFGDFYEQHQEDLQKMMQEFKNDFQFRYDDKWSKEINSTMKPRADLVKVQAKMMKLQKDRIVIQQKAMKIQDEAIVSQKIMKIQDEAMVKQKAMKMDMEKQFQYMERQHGEVEKKLKSMEENVERFEKALHEQLVKDGYLKSDEKINNMQWSDEGIEINNIKIKESDLPHYQDLHDRYFHIK
jgi:hypothetical protein